MRPITGADVPAVQALLARGHRWPVDGPEVRAWRRLRKHGGFATTLGAFHAGDLIGYVDYDPIPMRIANTTVPGAIAANLAVDPAWRHRRIATRLMDAQLAQVRDHGIALVAGSAAHVPFIRALGWEFASTVLRYEPAAAELADQLQHAPAAGAAAPLDADDPPVIRTIYDHSVRGRFGSFARTHAWWQLRVLTDPVRQHPRKLIGWKSTEDTLEGYAVIEEHQKVTRVVELHATTRHAYLGLRNTWPDPAAKEQPCDGPHQPTIRFPCWSPTPIGCSLASHRTRCSAPSTSGSFSPQFTTDESNQQP